MTVGQPLLAARRVSRRFGTRLALRPTDLEVRGGERVALLGPNGAGKSTLLSLLAGALAPSGGVVEQPAATRIGWAPQRPGSYGRLSARENLELFARLEKLPDAPGEALRALDAFALPRDSVPSADLSVGNRQRLNLAIALLGQPDVLLLDEPTASLDPQQRRRLWDVCAQVTVDGGAVVFATQNVDELESNAERVVVLREGALVFDGSFEQYRSSEEAHALV